MTKAMTSVGTRPEIIPLSRVMARLDETNPGSVRNSSVGASPARSPAPSHEPLWPPSTQWEGLRLGYRPMPARSTAVIRPRTKPGPGSRMPVGIRQPGD